jgi:translation initiation factor IF-3
LGIVETSKALALAFEADLDLVEVAPQAKPPVCKIMDFGKYKYAQRKKEQKSKSHRHESELKEVRIRTPKIDEHDLKIKLDHAREFLKRGDRVQFSLRFRARELAHTEVGFDVFSQIKAQLAEVSKIDQDVRREGRRITMVLSPGSSAKAKPAASAAQPARPSPAIQPIVGQAPTAPLPADPPIVEQAPAAAPPVEPAAGQ